ncbi:phosphodiester glycosidase family protein [Brevibacillus fulvus]|uniref:Exopolysaccharide biosynthesis protein n=1 Tax=Brevibacillus fulvus TaxID=1125967 RepID=A0A938Y0F8_9BACL|nr:phosphodiester glycosidase family protein [Brevibacillus fulvus]MBM7590189.1 exopolysaccharide biosynthesis protein [Brevibacillus fulvus]
MRARKMISLLAASVLAWGAFVSLPVNVAEATRAVTSSLNLDWQTPIGEGTTLLKYSKAYAGSPVTIYVTKVDLNNPYVEVKPVYGTNGKLTERQTVTNMAKETGAVAAINADFFNMNKRGAPFGIVMKDRELISSMGLISYWYSLGITSDKTAMLEHFGFGGKVTAQNGASYPLQGVNKEEYNPSEGRKSHQNQLNLYTPSFGKTSLGALSGYKDVVEVLVVDNVVKEVHVNKPGFYIPYNGYVLWGHGAAAAFLTKNFPVGSTASVEYLTTPTTTDWTQAVGGSFLIVDKGKPLSSFQTDSYIKQANSRTAVGVSQDGKTLYLVAVEGAKGILLDELAQTMVELGAYRALNFDGGGSTTMAARMLGDTQAKLINQPKGGSERRVPTGVAVYNTAPPGTLAGFSVDSPTEMLIGQTVGFTTKGYDNHYLPYQIDPSQIQWSVSDLNAGYFTNQQFTATASGTTTVTATVNGVTRNRQLHVISGQEVAQLIVSPNPINIGQGSTVKLDIKVKTKSGQLIQATPLSVQTAVSSSKATVNDQLQLVAGDEGGADTLTVTYDGVSTTVPIMVGETEQPWINFDQQTGMFHSGYPSSLSDSGSFAAVTEPVYRSAKAAKLQYNFSNASPNDVRIAYGNLAAKPLDIPGKPIGLGVWVYGDNSQHWLRAEVIDAKGKTVYLDLADEINWTGWKQVKGYFSGSVNYPLKLKSIYVVNRAENEDKPVKGTIYLDEISVLQPYNPAKNLTTKEVTPSAPGTLSLGSELDLGYSFAKSADYLQKASISTVAAPVGQLDYKLAGYGFTIKPVALKEGKQDQFAVSPAQLTFTPKSWMNGKGVGLLYVNETNGTYDTLPGTVDSKGNWVYQVNSYGTYLPYYLDKPDGVAFFDIIHHPAQAEITSLAQRGLVKGLTEDLFGPEVSLTRAQYVTLLARAFQWELPDDPRLNFKDAVPAYAQAAVQAAMEKGLVKGYPDQTFRPDQAVTRAEAAVILDRVLQKTAKPAQKPADQSSWPGWAAASINNLVGAGIIDLQGSKFEPNKPTTRAVCAVALYRALQ